MSSALSMARIMRSASVLVIVAFGIWCALSLSADLAKLSLTEIWRSWGLVLVATVLSLMNYVLRVLRWYWYMRRLGHQLTVGFAARTYVAGFAFTLTPAKAGELIRARYYVPCGIPLTHVIAAVVIERLLDLMAIALLAILIVNAFPNWQAAVWSTAGLIAFGGGLLALLPWRRLIKSPYVPWLQAFVMRAGRANLATLIHARNLMTPRVLVGGLLLGIVAWGLEGVGLTVLVRMVPEVQIDTPVAVGIYALALLAGAVSFLPGGLGSTEAVMAALLAASGCSPVAALMVTLTCRLVTLWLGVCLGWLAVLILRHPSRRQRRIAGERSTGI